MGINANVSGGQQITASVGETKIDVAVSGGVGPSGASGTPGAAASITVGTVTTGAPGSSASVVNAGSSSAAVLNFTIPAGADGAQGPQGPQGPAGSNASATTDASALVTGTLPDARLSANIARTSDVSSAVAAVVNAAPAALDTLNELAAALGNDASFSVTVTNALASKAPLANPTFTGTVSGITKAMVGLGNVPNTDATARANHTGTQAWSTIVSTPTTLSGYGITDGVTTSDSRLSDARTPLAHNQAWTTITSTPTTLAGYGITDAVGSSDARLTDARTPTAHKSSHATGGNDALTAADIGAAAALHTHSALDLTSGTLDIARLPVGQTSTTVAAGNDARFTDARTPTSHATSHNPGGSDPVTLVEVYEFTRTTRPAAATGSNGSYTFTIPAAAKMVEFFAIGAGGGGGSGRRGAAASARFGGGGGGSGGVMLITRTVAELSSRTVSLVIGAGGAGGAAVTANDTNGNNGSNGVDTAITISGRDHYASRGNGGSGGTAAAGTGGSGGPAMFGGTAGSNSSVTAAPSGSNVLGNAGYSAAGGGAGGGISTGDVSFGGAIGRAQGWFIGGANVNSSGGTAPGGNGQSASEVFTQVLGAQPGGAGAGGAAGNSTTAGGNGGNGANYGGAGGGGGASFNGQNSGAGGNGGDGFVRITVWY